jgi:CheY-like chemotaxis protein
MAEKRAVIFDDNELFLMAIARIFKSKNIQVQSYPNPCLYFCMQSGTDTCPVTTACADFLLTDQLMPEMTGLEFLERVKQMQCKIPDSRKAIISANWTKETFEEAKQLSMHVFKKFDAKEQVSLWIEQSDF